MIDNSCSPPHEDVVYDFAGEALRLVRSTHNNTYIGEKCFVKAYGNMQRYQAEVLAREKLFEYIPIIPILDHRPQIIKFALASEASFFDGQAISTAIWHCHKHIDPSLVEITWAEINDIRMRSLHNIYPELGQEMEELTRQIPDLKQVVIHADGASHNTLEYQNKVVLNDWEWLSIGIVEWDFTAANLRNTPAQVDQMISTYERLSEEAGDDFKIDRDILNLLSRIRELHSIAWAGEIGQRDKKYREKAEEHIALYRQGRRAL